MERMALRRPALLLLCARVPGTQCRPQQQPQIQRCFKSSVRSSGSPHSLRSVHHQRKEFANLEPALREFHERHGHWAVPLRFTIPLIKPQATATLQSPPQELHNTDWPEELQGMKLGTTLSRFVKVAQRPENAAIAAKLAALGVPVDSVVDWKRHIWEQVAVVALQTFRGLHGHFFVPYSFKVPAAANDWPRQTWGYKLGYWVVELRRDPSRLESYQLEDLRAMGFVWNAREERWNQYFVPTMKKYGELYGKQSVPQSFVVPKDDERWPKELQGYRLGQKVNNLRCGGDKAGSSASPSSKKTEEGMEWDEVELVYNNWLFLDILHEDADSNKKTTSARTEDSERQ